VLAVVVFGAVRGVSSLTEDKVAGDAPPTMTSGDAGSTTALASAVTTSGGLTTPVPQVTGHAGPPTRDNPAQVLVIGDSDAGTFGPYLQDVVDDWTVVDVELDYVSSTGLARPDYKVEWPRRLSETLAGSDPDIIVVTFGGNDAQGLSEPCPNGPDTCDAEFVVGEPTADNAQEWTTEYVRRIREMMNIMLEDPDRRVIWVGIPNDIDSEEVTSRLRLQNEAVHQALEAYPDTIFIDTWGIFDGVNGGRAELIVDPRNGEAIPVRAADGFHLNQDGAEILAFTISEKIKGILQESGADV